jgi:organic radical activating enzyme
MKSCNLKAKQKVFRIQHHEASSCCIAYPISLRDFESVSEVEKKWQVEVTSLDQGIEIPTCEPCWSDEHSGIESLRQRTATIAVDNIIELVVDNTCNQICSYCSPKFSSAWQQSIQQQGMFKNISASAQKNLQLLTPSNHTSIWIDRIGEYINLCENNSLHLTLLGGEPLMQLRNLQNLLSANPNKISKLEIVTNLNPPNPKYLYWVLETFPLDKLKFVISLDATPIYNHVPRGKFNQVEFEKNLQLLKSYKVNYSFSAVVSILSIFDISNFIQWIHNEKISFNQINNPDCLNPKYLPKDIKTKILDSISHLKVPKIVSDLLSSSEKSFDLKLFEQYNYVSQYFQRAEIDPLSIDNQLFQHYWQWIDTFAKEKYENLNSQ